MAPCNCKSYHTTLEYSEDARCRFLENIVAPFWYGTFCMILICCFGYTSQCTDEICAFQEGGVYKPKL
jgi:hypothetical protein